MKIETETLKKALDYLSMGIGKSADKYENQLIEFETSNGKLKAYTSDDVNKLGIRICDCTDEFNVTLKFDILYSLVKACKDSEIEIIANKNFTQFKTKTISCKLSTFNHNITRPEFPKYTDKMNGKDLVKYLPMIKSILNTSHTVECYRYVYFGDNIMVTDTDNVAIITEKVFDDILLQLHSLEILSSFEDFDYIVGKTKICVCSGDKIADITLMNKAEYQYKDLLDLFNTTSTNKITLTKELLSSAISTAALFDNETINLVFNNDGIKLEMPSVEFSYILSTFHCIDRTYTMPLTLLKKFLVIGDNLTIGYDNDSLIYVENDNIKTIYGVEANGS